MGSSLNTASRARTSNLFLVLSPDLTEMSAAHGLALFLLFGLLVGAALGAGCLGPAPPEVRESVTAAPTPGDGVSGGTLPPGSETTIPIPIPIGG